MFGRAKTVTNAFFLQMFFKITMDLKPATFHLLRITVFRTAEKDTYAIISSQPHINDDSASEMLIFNEIFVDYALSGKINLPDFGAASYQTYAKWLERLDSENEFNYWRELLSNAPEIRLPGRIHSSLESNINTLMLNFFT